MVAQDRYRVAALARGLKVLSLFDSGTPALDLAAIGRCVGLARATALRTVRTLCDLGFLECVPNTARYQPSVSAAAVGRAAIESNPAVRAAIPIMKRLSAELGATVNFGVLLDQSIYYVWRFKVGNLLGGASPTGARLPAYCTSAGKLLLAFAPDAVRNRYLRDTKLERRGPNTITDPKVLARDLEKVARRGYAIQDQEFASGFRSAAVPIRTGQGVIEAALNVAMPVGTSLVVLEREITPRLVAAARQISQSLVDDLENAVSHASPVTPRRGCLTQSRYHVAALSHGLEMLRLLSETGPLRQAQMAQSLGLSPATVHRIVETLIDANALHRAPKSGALRLSLGTIRFGYSAICAMELSDIAAPVLYDLYRQLQANIHLGVVAGQEMINVFSLRRPDLIPMHGQRFPTYCTATGKMWLADRPAGSKADLVGHLDMKSLGPNTHMSTKTLMRDLEETRRRGYSVSDEEIYPGICVVGAAVRGGEGRFIAGVAASVLKHLYPANAIHSRVAPLVIAAAAKVSDRLCFRIDDNPALRASSA